MVIYASVLVFLAVGVRIDAHMCNPGYNVLVHFTISYDNLKTAAIGFATAVATLAQFQ